MALLDTDVAKMQGLYLKHFGIELNYQEAYAKLALLVLQMKHIYKPITAEQYRGRGTTNEDEKRDNYDDSVRE